MLAINRITDTIYLNLLYCIYYATLFDAIRKSYQRVKFLNRLWFIELKLKQLIGPSDFKSYPTIKIWQYVILAVCQALGVVFATYCTIHKLCTKYIILYS